VPDGDLAQIAAMALIKAVDRFDSERGSRFEAFLAPTVVGELKRYFRDHTWAVRMPRRLQELALRISEANGRLAQQLGRSPTVRDLAEDLGVDEEQILEGLECSWSYSCAPLNTTGAGDDYALDVSRGPDLGTEQVDNWQSLRPLLRQLPRREQQILEMRFIDEMTQTQIGARIGVSQMQVSRLLAQCLAQLRHRMLADI
jgi:RNA polymerase sigma-B factor